MFVTGLVLAAGASRRLGRPKQLLHSGRYELVRMPVPGPVPIDVDAWQDYQDLLAQGAPS